MKNVVPLLVGLARSTRPTTALYAGTLAHVSLRSSDTWQHHVLISITFALITMAIMIFNDLVDAKHDRRKRKTFASNYFDISAGYWICLIGANAALIQHIHQTSTQLSWFLLAVLTTGLLYSFMRRLTILNNVTVALCSGSPALCGYIYQHDMTHVPTFLCFTCLIFINEIYKDLEDDNIDRGYKDTIPTTWGTNTAWHITRVCIGITAAIFILHPNPLFQVVAWSGLLFLWSQTKHRSVPVTMKAMRRLLIMLILVLVVSR